VAQILQQVLPPEKPADPAAAPPPEQAPDGSAADADFDDDPPQ
jgi:hypothetical protein